MKRIILGLTGRATDLGLNSRDSAEPTEGWEQGSEGSDLGFWNTGACIC